MEERKSTIGEYDVIVNKYIFLVICYFGWVLFHAILYALKIISFEGILLDALVLIIFLLIEIIYFLEKLVNKAELTYRNRG